MINILLNIFFGPVVNAARGIAAQVNTAVISFSQNFSTALRPQIIKNYAAGQKVETMKLVFRGCKFTFFLMYIFALPLFLEMDIVLKLWLKNPPEFAIIFTQLALVDAVIDSISFPLMTLAQATGKIKLYQGVVGGVLLCNLPVSYIALKFGAPCYIVMIIAICITFTAFIIRLFIVRHLSGLSISLFLINCFIPCLIVSLFSAVLPFLFSYYSKTSFLRFCLTVVISVLCTTLCVLYIGMNKIERDSVFRSIKNKLGIKK